MTHKLPELPYALDALAPLMSRETLEYHYGKHLQAYVDNLNKLIPGTPYEQLTVEQILCKADGAIFNNAAQIWNHMFFFEQFPPGPKQRPERLTRELEASFESFEAFKEAFTKAALGLFGSGWVWLVRDADRKLQIVSKPNAGNPLTDGQTPLMVIDVWEHAYYIDHRNRRADFVEAFWQLVNWQKVDAR